MLRDALFHKKSSGGGNMVDILEAFLLQYAMLYKILFHNNLIVVRRRYVFRLMKFVEGLGIPT